MNTPHETAPSRQRAAFRLMRLEPRDMAMTVSAILVIFAAVMGVIQVVEERYRRTTSDAVNTILESTDGAIRTWLQDQELLVANLADLPEVARITQSLIATEPTRQALLAAPAMASIRALFQPYLSRARAQGFFIVGTDGLSLASSRDSNVGEPNLLTAQPDVLAALWRGEQVNSRVQRSDVPLLDQTEIAPGTRDLTMFVAAPIRAADGTVIAALALRLDPNRTLYPLLLNVRMGRSGEAYLFDRQAVMLSPSRFDEQLVDAGRLTAGQSSALNLRIVDPRASRGDEPGRGVLTQMAESATRGERDSNAHGYRDYRGVPVVGAWTWNEKLAVGLTFEQDRDEAYEVFHLIRNLVISAGLVSALTVIWLVLSFVKGRRNLREAQARLSALVDGAVDSIIVIDGQGTIESVNPAVERMFGHSAQALIGRNVKCLMPAAYAREHDRYLADYQASHEAKIIGVGREVEACRADGSVFPIDLAVSELKLDSGVRFAGVIRDASARKAAEQAIEDERRFSEAVLNSLSACIAVLDASGCIVFVNDAWRAFGQDNGLSANMDWRRQNYKHVVEAAATHGDETAIALAGKLCAVLDGELQEFSMEYPCHGPEAIHWFHLRVSRFELHGRPMIVTSHTDITARYVAESRLRWKKEAIEETNRILALTQTALEHAGIGEYWVRIRDARIMRVNDWACNFLGYSRNELTGMTVLDLVPDYTFESFQAHAQRIQTRGWDRFDSTNRAKDGRVLPLGVSVMYRSAGPGGEDMLIAFAFDISDRKRAEDELRVAKEAAESANRAKSVFLATMSHEIRTPLNGVVGTIDLLGKGSLNENQRALVRTAKDSSLALLSIIDDILDFSKIEAGRMDLERVPLSFETLLESVADTLLPLANKRNTDLLMYCDPALPTVMGDPTRLRQILLNLASNAVKFSGDQTARRGVVEICAELRAASPTQAAISLSVRDNGIGMTPEVAAKLFQPFAQAESSTTRRFGGTGLGLVISRRLAEMMGGAVDVQSVPGEGATFSVSIQLEIAEALAGAPAPDLGGLRVLLVEGGALATVILERYLISAAAQVVRVRTEALPEHFEALGATPETGIVVIENEGDEARAEALREQVREGVSHDHVRFLNVGRGRRRSVRRLGDDGLSVDLNAMRRSVLVNAVAALAGRQSPDVAAIEPEWTPISVPLSADAAKAAGRLVLLAEDNETNQHVISEQLRMLGYLAQVAGDGRQALEMWRRDREAYAVLLTDCHMPHLDGYDLTRAIRAEEGEGQRLPVIAITADALKGTAGKCEAAGMDGYLTKPLQLTDLEAKLNECLGGDAPGVRQMRAAADAAIGAELVEADGAGEDAVVDANALCLVLGVDDPGMLASFYADFADTSARIVADGRRAVAMGDLAALSEHMHKLKSSARTIGADALADCCAGLESAGRHHRRAEVGEAMAVFDPLYEAVLAWVARYVARHME